MIKNKDTSIWVRLHVNLNSVVILVIIFRIRRCFCSVSVFNQFFLKLILLWYMHSIVWGPWWLSGRELACQCRSHRFAPCVRKIPWRRKWQPTPVSLPRKPHGQRSLIGCIVHGVTRVRHNLATEGQQQWHCTPHHTMWEPQRTRSPHHTACESLSLRDHHTTLDYMWEPQLTRSPHHTILYVRASAYEITTPHHTICESLSLRDHHTTLYVRASAYEITTPH